MKVPAIPKFWVNEPERWSPESQLMPLTAPLVQVWPTQTPELVECGKRTPVEPVQSALAQHQVTLSPLRMVTLEGEKETLTPKGPGSPTVTTAVFADEELLKTRNSNSARRTHWTANRALPVRPNVTAVPSTFASGRDAVLSGAGIAVSAWEESLGRPYFITVGRCVRNDSEIWEESYELSVALACCNT